MSKQKGKAIQRNKLKFKSLFYYELKHSPGVVIKILAGLMILFALIATQNSTTDYKQLIKRADEFKKVEAKLASNFINYRQYGTYGIRIIYAPQPLSILFYQSSLFPEITAYIDSGIRQRVYKSIKGREALFLKKSNFSDFSGVIIFFGTLLALFYGFDAFNKKEYLQFLGSCSNKKTLYLAIFTARLLKLSLLYLLLLSGAVLLTYLNGVIIPCNGYLVLFFALLFMHMFFFFTLGTCFVNIKSKLTGFIVILICWYFFLFFSPNLIQSIVARKADNIRTTYDLEMEKLEIFSDFEKKIIKNQGTSSYTKKINKEIKKMIKEYLNKPIQKIISIDNKQSEQTLININNFHKMSILLPTNFYISSINEISSLGYKNLLDFYNYISNKKLGFVAYVMEKIYFENFSKVISFEDGKSNVFFGKNRLPDFFVIGVSINLIYIMLLMVISYFCYKAILYRLPLKSKMEPEKQMDIILNPGIFKEWLKKSMNFKNRLYTLLSGEIKEIKKKGDSLKITIKGIDLSMIEGGIDFLYLCHPRQIPQTIKTKNLVSLMNQLEEREGENEPEQKDKINSDLLMNKKFGKLDFRQKGEVLLTLLNSRQASLYLMNDIIHNMPLEYHIRLKETIDKLTGNGSIVLFLTTYPLLFSFDKELKEDFFEENTWAMLVARFKKHIDRGGKTST